MLLRLVVLVLVVLVVLVVLLVLVVVVVVVVVVVQLLLPRTERRRPWSSRCIASAAASTAASLSSMAPRDSSSARSLAWC